MNISTTEQDTHLRQLSASSGSLFKGSLYHHKLPDGILLKNTLVKNSLLKNTFVKNTPVTKLFKCFLIHWLPGHQPSPSRLSRELQIHINPKCILNIHCIFPFYYISDISDIFALAVTSDCKRVYCGLRQMYQRSK